MKEILRAPSMSIFTPEPATQAPAPAGRRSWKARVEDNSGEVQGLLALLGIFVIHTMDLAKIVTHLTNIASSDRHTGHGCIMLLDEAAMQIAKETGAAIVDVWAVLLDQLMHESKPARGTAHQITRLLRQRLQAIPVTTQTGIIALWEEERPHDPQRSTILTKQTISYSNQPVQPVRSTETSL